MKYLIPTLLVLPLLEIFVLIEVGSYIGALSTIGLVLLTAVLGLVLLRHEGLTAINKARNKLLKALNPILTKYMSENNIQIIIDKKYVIMADSKIDLTGKILEILNKELKSLNLK